VNILRSIAGIYSNSTLSKFLFNALGLYLLWHLFYISPSDLALSLDRNMLLHLTGVSKWIIQLLGYEIFESSEYTFGIVGSSGIRIGPPCNGITLMALFSGFILAFPSKIKEKIKVLIFGLALIHVLNIIRIILLIIIANYRREWLEFNHDYTFTITIYVITFFIWMYWINGLKRKSTTHD